MKEQKSQKDNLKIYNYKSKNSVIAQLAKECLKEIYELSAPATTYEEIEKKCVEYKDKNSEHCTLVGKNGKIYSWPYDFYYMPQELQNTIIDNYADVYNLNSNWKPYIETLENYLHNHNGESVRTVYTTDEDGLSHKNYEKVPALDDVINEEDAMKVYKMISWCKNFYKYGQIEESQFKTAVMFRSPITNRNYVIEAWKEVFGKDIEIPEDSTWTDEYDDRLLGE